MILRRSGAAGQRPLAPRQAVAEAERVGGHLVRIEDEAERVFVARLVQKGREGVYWIDGAQDVTPGDWRYSDDQQQVKFFAWAPREPSRARSETNLLIYKANGQFGDCFHNERLGMVVEWDQ